MRSRVVPVAALLAVVVGGCGGGSGGGEHETYPVEGRLLLDDQPFGPATVTFQPDDPNMPVPAGSVAADGTFTLTTYDDGDGAPAGSYRVSVGPDMTNMSQGIRFPPQPYTVASTSPLTAEVQAQDENVITLRMESSAGPAEGPPILPSEGAGPGGGGAIPGAGAGGTFPGVPSPQ